MDGFPVLLTQFSNTSRETEEHEFLLSHTIANVYVIDFRTHELLFANEPAMYSAAEPPSWIPRVSPSMISRDGVFCWPRTMKSTRRSRAASWK